MNHIILGAGKFSHAHVRVLAEFNINDIIICKRSAWLDSQRDIFTTRYPAQTFTFCNNLDIDTYYNSIVHIVTPSDQHLNNMLDAYKHASRLFVEKPAVLLHNNTNFEQINHLKMQCDIPIYHNDWLAGLYDYLSNKHRPAVIHFNYDVANNDPGLDLITEIASHSCNLLSLWVSPQEPMTVMMFEKTNNRLKMQLQFSNNLEIHITVSQGIVSQSSWQCKIDAEEFSSTTLKGQLLSAAFDRVINNKSPLTDWYNASWLTCKLHMHNEQLKFNSLINKWYII